VKEKLFRLLSFDEPEAFFPNQFLDCTLRHSKAPFYPPLCSGSAIGRLPSAIFYHHNLSLDTKRDHEDAGQLTTS
jgi:hypothetical protein